MTRVILLNPSQQPKQKPKKEKESRNPIPYIPKVFPLICLTPPNNDIFYFLFSDVSILRLYLEQTSASLLNILTVSNKSSVVKLASLTPELITPLQNFLIASFPRTKSPSGGKSIESCQYPVDVIEASPFWNPSENFLFA